MSSGIHSANVGCCNFTATLREPLRPLDLCLSGGGGEGHTLGQFPSILPDVPEPKTLSQTSVSYNPKEIINRSSIPAPKGVGSNDEKSSGIDCPVSSRIICTYLQISLSIISGAVLGIKWIFVPSQYSPS